MANKSGTLNAGIPGPTTAKVLQANIENAPPGYVATFERVDGVGDPIVVHFNPYIFKSGKLGYFGRLEQPPLYRQVDGKVSAHTTKGTIQMQLVYSHSDFTTAELDAGDHKS